ncbi:hypothetical protein GOP47_0017527 [Adiantum capillus-veneris]|uniref:Uncharacterized protein n=1 Tax=Adiantum capillus-veneris TaxID=13818 RepID=A0A9D4Z9S1_ADICA|nr:hypothetical protein GOP47_0017527 [Adiantum capillus-veneris]
MISMDIFENGGFQDDDCMKGVHTGAFLEAWHDNLENSCNLNVEMDVTDAASLSAYGPFLQCLPERDWIIVYISNR